MLLFGTFDGLHPGHRFVLDAAQQRGAMSVVIARDATVQRIKGYAPVADELQRLQAVQQAYPDAAVMLGDAEDFLAPVRAVQPDLIMLGYDQRLPPGVRDEDFPCPVERLTAFHPEQFKSSKLRPRMA